MRLLVITHTFPPSFVSNAKRPYYVVRELLEAGWKVDVFTSRLGLRKGESETVAHPNLRILRPADTLLELTNRSFRQQWARWMSLAVNAVIWPDYAVRWARKAIAHAARHRSDYDRVLANVFPASVLLAGRTPGLVDSRWVIDLQEPTSTLYSQHPRRSPLQRAWLPRTIRLERETMAQAARVIFTAKSNLNASLELKLVDAAKAVHIPFFYDASVFEAPTPPVADRFEIGYFGLFDWRGERSPETFLRSFAKFLERHPEARPRSRFAFYGAWLQEHNRFIEELRLQEVVSLSPAVPYEDYLKKLRASPVLLLVVAREHNLYMPSKIVDYFGARRPILAFVNRQAEMREVLDSAGMSDFACDEFDVEAGASALGRLWEQFRAGGLTVSSERAAQWSSRQQLARYREVLEQAGCSASDR